MQHLLNTIINQDILSKMIRFARWVPVYPDSSQRLAIMSIGFLLNTRDDAVVWRGPKKNGV